MKDLFKNKKVLIIGAIVLVLIVLLGIIFLVISRSNSSDQANQGVQAIPTQVPIPMISADSIGLTLETGTPGKTVIVKVAKTSGIKDIEYELTYTAKGNIPRGTLGKIELTNTPAKAEITLGTCSDVCHYDEGISGIKIVLKITKDDGKVYQSVATLASAK